MRKFVFCSTFLGLLAGCHHGGGDGNETTITPSPTTLISAPDDVTSDLRFYSFNSSTLTITSGGGLATPSSDRISIDGLTGTLNSTGDIVSLDSGGTISLTLSDSQRVASFVVERPGADPEFGVIGLAGNVTALPDSGSVTYRSLTGANVQIIDATTLYDLTGSVEVVANFDDNVVEIDLSQLSGERSTATTNPVSVQNVANINIVGASLVEGRFSGGSASLTGQAGLRSESDFATANLDGEFFGSENQSVGGTVVLSNNPSGGDLLVLGTFVAE